MPRIILYSFIAINIITFIIFGYDKWLAKNSKRRVSEKNLLLISLLGGSIGGIFGMLFFRHKVSKGSFLWKFMVVILIHFVVIYFLFSKNFIDYQNIK